MKVHRIMNVCASSQRCTMVKGASTTTTAASAYKAGVGRPKKFSQSWSSVMKRIYVTEEVFLEFHDLKNSSSFASDDSTLHYLLMIQPFVISSEESYSIYSNILHKTYLIT